MMLLFYSLFTSALCAFGNAQSALADNLPTYGDSLSIQYIDLRVNPLVFSEVKKYINEQQDSSQLFREGFGYVVIGDIKSWYDGSPIPVDSLLKHQKDIKAGFNIGLSSFYPNLTFDMGIPLYYSFMENRLVLIFDGDIQWLHKDRYAAISIQKAKSLVKQTLKQALDNPEFQFKNVRLETFELTPERRELLKEDEILDMASFTLGKLKRVIEYVDGTVSYHYFPR
jgi:hypothetical protein